MLAITVENGERVLCHGVVQWRICEFVSLNLDLAAVQCNPGQVSSTHGLREGDEHTHYGPLWSMVDFTGALVAVW